MDDLKYLSGFGSHIETEAMEGALPVGQNSPQKVAYGLYAEQLSGTAFTAPRCKNQRSWLYRIRPRVLQQVSDEAATQIDYGASSPDQSVSDMDSMFVSTPKQMRWSPAEPERQDVDFVDGLQPVCGAGNSSMKEGMCIYNYVFNKDMKQARGGRTMCNADGDFLIVPQQGALAVYTEMGNLLVKPCEILVIPRGVVFSVNWQQSGGEDVTFARGYIAELFKGHLELPNLGPLGANGLANPRDFLAPVAAFEDVDGDDVSYSLVHKFHGRLFEGTIAFSPFDVVAWHGNYYPYKYDLNRFNTVNTVSFDHPDPSIFTVLTAQTDEPGVAALDFVIFPPRWMVAENTFRPPYFHRNCMSEYMGMVYGRYDNKATGFYPGGASLHPCMSAHGADATTFEKASEKVLEPEYFEGGLAFMFESTYLFKVSKRAMAAPTNQGDYMDCWKDIKKLYTGKK